MLSVTSAEGTIDYVVTGGFAQISAEGTSVLAERAMPVGEVKAVRNEGEATVVDLAMEGEGETWDQSLRLVLKDNGDRLHVTEPSSSSDTDDFPRKRCPA